MSVDAGAESSLGNISDQLQISRSEKFFGCFSDSSLLQRGKE